MLYFNYNNPINKSGYSYKQGNKFTGAPPEVLWLHAVQHQGKAHQQRVHRHDRRPADPGAEERRRLGGLTVAQGIQGWKDVDV